MRYHLLVTASVAGLAVLVGSIVGLEQGLGEPNSADAKTSAINQQKQAETESKQSRSPSGTGRFAAIGGGLPGDHTFQQLSLEPVKWQKPEGTPPEWLASAKNSTEAVERLRTTLGESIKVNLVESTLTQAIHQICDPKSIQVEINASSLDNDGVDPQEKVSLEAEGPLRDVLRRLLEPRYLEYIVHESCIEITTTGDAQKRPTLRCYDLAFVQRDDAHVNELLETIEANVPSDYWTSGALGDLSIIGSLLVTTTTEPAHQRIEALLYKLSQASHAPAEVSANPTPSPPR